MAGWDTCSPRWTTGICETNEIHIHYLRTGGDLPPLIALHGLLGSGACLSPLARTLMGSFDVVLSDARGHGRSSAPRKGYLYPDLAGDVVALIYKLSLKAPVLLGHSMGGMTAALVASQIGSALSGVILVDPTFITPEWQREVFEGDLAQEHRQMHTLSKPDLLAQAHLRRPRRSAELLEYLVPGITGACSMLRDGPAGLLSMRFERVRDLILRSAARRLEGWPRVTDF